MNIANYLSNLFRVDDLIDESNHLSGVITELVETEKKVVSLKWSLFRGVFYGFGVFLGSVILVAFLVWVLSQINTAPVIGDYVSKILDQIDQHR